MINIEEYLHTLLSERDNKSKKSKKPFSEMHGTITTNDLLYAERTGLHRVSRTTAQREREVEVARERLEELSNQRSIFIDQATALSHSVYETYVDGTYTTTDSTTDSTF